MEIKEVAALRINLAEYYGLDEIEKFDYLFSLYEKQIAVGMQYGVGRFEALLTPIAFSGKVDSKTAKDILNLVQ